MTSARALLLSFFVIGCGANHPSVDGGGDEGHADATVRDGAVGDATHGDAGDVDGGAVDASDVDAPDVDGGDVDAAVDASDVEGGALDGGDVDASDGGELDGGESDGGALDAGESDAGSSGDAGSVDAGPTCGDGVIQAPEQCDGADLGGQSCLSFGFAGGALSCNAACAFDTSGCSSPESCTNGIDDDGDALVDCADPDCSADASCVTWSVGFCRLQFPLAITAAEGAGTTAYGRVYAAGLTDRTTGVDTSVRLLAEVGVGPAGSDPISGSGWTWTPASPNPGWDGSAFGEPNNDEYQATLVTPGPHGSMHDYAYRFSGDGGAVWTYCDSDTGGSTTGYMIANAGHVATTTLDTIFFSEYIEGSGNNKALEIYNGYGVPFDLTGCSLRVYSNGAATAISLALTTTIAAGDVFVVCNAATSVSFISACDLSTSSPVLGFNGDDALELSCAGTTVDVIGQIGFDPGSEWGLSGSVTTTQNHTLRRMCSVTAGDAVGSDAFTPATQWDGFAADSFDDLGTYACP